MRAWQQRVTLRTCLALAWVVVGCGKSDSANTFNIVVTDSGLGGISVAADVVETIRTLESHGPVRVTFFNAQPRAGVGFNGFETDEEKVRVFDSALFAMAERLEPDVILVACNTLSVLLDDTAFVQTQSVPVMGIIDAGVQLLESRLGRDDTSRVAIFATRTTVDSNVHKGALIDAGVAADRIINQACPGLAGSIERGPESAETQALVSQYVAEAAGELPTDAEASPLFVSLNCTHYGYARRAFEASFAALGIVPSEYLDPNTLMFEASFFAEYPLREGPNDLVVRVISQPKLSSQRVSSIAEAVQQDSPLTAEALRDYEFTPDFYVW